MTRISRLSSLGQMSVADSWPKTLEPLTAEQEAVYDDFVKRWHEVLPRRYGLIERFNHSFPVRHSSDGFRRTLEIGAGLGEHLRHERLSPEQEEGYYAVELRENMAEQIRADQPQVTAIVGDCQRRLPFPDGHFDRYLAIHVLEHLPDLPACVREAWRLLDKERGQLLAVIPCEGGLLYSIARRISAQRIFERTYGMPYAPFIAREHLNRPKEILAELHPYFTLTRRGMFPLPFLPVTTVNLCIGLSLRPRKAPTTAGAAVD
jgi:SAM-dependent methyltransferase